MIRKAAFKFVSVLLTIITVFAFSSCTKDEIADFYSKMEKADSAEIVMQMTVPMFGSVILTMKFEDNKFHQSEFMNEPEKYMEIDGDTMYTYTKSGLQWTKDGGQPYDAEEIMTESEEFVQLFNSDNYEYDKEEKAYILKEDLDLTFAEMDVLSMSLKISSDGCEFDGEFSTGGIIVPMELKIKNLNKTEVTLPQTQAAA